MSANWGERDIVRHDCAFCGERTTLDERVVCIVNELQYTYCKFHLDRGSQIEAAGEKSPAPQPDSQAQINKKNGAKRANESVDTKTIPIWDALCNGIPIQDMIDHGFLGLKARNGVHHHLVRIKVALGVTTLEEATYIYGSLGDDRRSILRKRLIKLNEDYSLREVQDLYTARAKALSKEVRNERIFARFTCEVT